MSLKLARGIGMTAVTVAGTDKANRRTATAGSSANGYALCD